MIAPFWLVIVPFRLATVLFWLVMMFLWLDSTPGYWRRPPSWAQRVFVSFEWGGVWCPMDRLGPIGPLGN